MNSLTKAEDIVNRLTPGLIQCPKCKKWFKYDKKAIYHWDDSIVCCIDCYMKKYYPERFEV